MELKAHIFLFAVAMAFIGPIEAQTPSATPPAFTREDAQKNLATMRRIVTPNGIEALEQVEIGGIKQWIQIRSHDTRNPVLLFLHGGPGYSNIATTWHSTRGWEEYFTVVNWDQRGAGKTYASNDAQAILPTITKERMIADTEEMIALIRKRFGKRKIFLVGHSWGSVLGMEMALRHPDWLHAYIGMGQSIDFQESERRGWQFTLDQARAAGDTKNAQALESVADAFNGRRPITPRDLYTQRPLLEAYGGAIYRRKGYETEVAAVRLAPDYTAADRAAFNVSTEYAMLKLLPELVMTDFSKIDRLACPIIIFNGRHDYNVSQSVAAEWFSRLKTPSKALIWFENSGHMMMNEEQGKTLIELVRLTRPIAEKAGDVPPE